MRWKDERGYTLVELVISMAILAIVAGSITLLMQSGTRSYSNTKAELDLQMESQTLMAQLNTMILESNAVKYDKDNKILVLYQIETKHTPLPTVSGDATAKLQYEEQRTVDNVKLIKFKGDQLFLEEHDNDITLPASGGTLTYSDDELLADYMDQFDVAIDGNKVTVSMKMKSGKRTYEMKETTKIRNGLVACP